MADLGINIAGMHFKNPVTTASGCFGYGEEFRDFYDPGLLGGIFVKAVTGSNREGNKYPRMAETTGGMLNSVGLQNKGVDNFCKVIYPGIKDFNTHLIVNVSGSTIDEYVMVAERINELEGIPAIELNISCPNVKEGGIQFGTDPAQVAKITAALRKVCKKNILIVKLSPNVTDITATARAAVENGADALSMGNTFTAMVIDVENRRPVLGNGTGGLSGPAIRPIAVRMVHQVYSQVTGPAGVPIIGMGGIQYARDAVEFLLAGATALAVGTALFVNPGCIVSIRDGIADYLRRHHCRSVKEIIGAVHA